LIQGERKIDTIKIKKMRSKHPHPHTSYTFHNQIMKTESEYTDACKDSSLNDYFDLLLVVTKAQYITSFGRKSGVMTL
jgi:hypothetical protein